MSIQRDVHTTRRPYNETSIQQDIHTTRCPYDKMSIMQNIIKNQQLTLVGPLSYMETKRNPTKKLAIVHADNHSPTANLAVVQFQ